jgi:hypothetical protein
VDIGSDDEKALTKAIEIVFPSSKRSLCTKHLKENVSDYIKNKVGTKSKDRKQLIDSIFGEHGILNAADAFQFEERRVQLLTTENTSVFSNYFQKTLKPRPQCSTHVDKQQRRVHKPCDESRCQLEAAQHTSTS